MRHLVFCLALGLAACGDRAANASPVRALKPAEAKETTDMTATQFTSINGKPLDLTALGAKAVLVVNTASKCGFTPQYKGLQALYDTHKDAGLVIVGVPSNDFGGQEPGSEAEVKSFCELNYGVTFPLTQKYPVTGAGQHPFYTAAVKAIGAGAQPKWNFHKVLVAADGTPLKAYPSATKPSDAELLADIAAALEN
jgi:glutathione peroxidase